MADTRVQLEVEKWIRNNWLPARFGQRFQKRELRLVSGGVFAFDGVGRDGKIAVVISTSGAKTSSGKPGSGKMTKIRSDVYFLLLVRAKRRAVIFTERDMYVRYAEEVGSGRVPREVEYYLAGIPHWLKLKLEASRQASIREMKPPTEERRRRADSGATRGRHR